MSSEEDKPEAEAHAAAPAEAVAVEAAPTASTTEAPPADVAQAAEAATPSDAERATASNVEPAKDAPAAEEAALPPPASARANGPGISSVSPEHVGQNGGSVVSIFGGGFEDGAMVWIDNVHAACDWVDAFCVRFHAPPHPPGEALVEVENPNGDKTKTATRLVYVAGPGIASVSPHNVPPEGGVEIIVEGSGFDEGCTVNLFGVHAPPVVRESDTVLKFVAPPRGQGPTEGALTVTNPDGIATRYDDALFYRALDPTIEGVEPNSGWVSGGKAIAVHGRDFHQACVALFGDRVAEVRFKNASLLEVIVPRADAPGPASLAIQNPDGSGATASTPFVYEPIPAPPKLISVTPDKGHTTGGSLVRLSGDNFTESMRVKIADVSARARILSAKLAEVELPARTLPGAVAVELSEDGVVIRVEDAFTYVSPKAPKFVTMEPSAGPATGGTKVVIEGSDFPPNASVRFGGEPSKHVVVKKDGRTLETITPASKRAGMVDVEISSPETGPGVMKNGFRYDVALPPTITSVAPAKGGTNGGTELTIEGKNFVEGLAVFFGKVPAKSVRRISGSMLEVKTPAGDDGQLTDVIVKHPDGKEAVAERAFQYDARYRG